MNKDVIDFKAFEYLADPVLPPCKDVSHKQKETQQRCSLSTVFNPAQLARSSQKSERKCALCIGV